MIRSEFTDIPPGEFASSIPQTFFTSLGSVAAVTPTASEVTFNNSGPPKVINVTFTTPWSAI
jgi:hypothetical protein